MKFYDIPESDVHQISFLDEAGRLSPGGMERWRSAVGDVLKRYEFWRIDSHTVTPIMVGGTTYGLIVAVVAYQPIHEESAD